MQVLQEMVRFFVVPQPCSCSFVISYKMAVPLAVSTTKDDLFASCFSEC